VDGDRHPGFVLRLYLGAPVPVAVSPDAEGVGDMGEDYQEFLARKSHLCEFGGFEPVYMPDYLFDFQKHLVDWAVKKGRCALFADCGLGKTPMQLVWAKNIVRQTNNNVLILTPLAVSHQTVKEGAKFGVECYRSDDGKPKGKITVTNYERLHLFDHNDYVGVVCDESSILKSFSGSTRKAITRFMSKKSYRLLCTATAAPNDYVELGTSSEALGELNNSDMLKMFFKYLDDKGQKKENRLQAEAENIIYNNASYYQKLAYRVSQTIGQWRLKHHAVLPFWQWVSSWARACRMPSDLGFPDGDFVLPPLIEKDHVISSSSPPPGYLFCLPAKGLHEERQERRRTIIERSEYISRLVNHNESAVIWAHMNDEADMLEKIIPDAMQIAGRTPDNKKIELYEAFANGSLRVLIIKPKIGAWGLNWQHCNHVVTYVSHSYEQYYQSIRRCWRFGQKKPVCLDVISTEGEKNTLINMRKKAERANIMFESIVKEMNMHKEIKTKNIYTKKIEPPQWLQTN
jgi:hypothetical protein